MGRISGKENKDTIKAMISPTIRDIEWASGFIEGEGWVNSSNNSDRVVVCQKDKEPLIRLQRLFGGPIVQKKAKGILWEWRIYGARARGVMLTIYSLMSNRRKEQIVAALR